MSVRVRHPKNRKSPYRHRVRSHTRQGKHVRSYERGKGSKRKVLRRHRLKPEAEKKGTVFTGRIEYPDRSSETFRVPAGSYIEAINPALQRRRQPKDPLAVVLRRSTA